MLTVENLNYSYGSHKVLNDLCMHVEKGQLYGLVGRNGAGKTTTMKILSGIIDADSGRVTLNGVDFPRRNHLRDIFVGHSEYKKIGYMPDNFGVYNNLSALEYLDFYAGEYGLTGKKKERRIAEILEMMNISELSEKLVSGMSRGMKQKLGLARTMINDPDLLILDEPSSGVEPEGQVSLRDMLIGLCSEGKTIIISSHVLSELTRLCTNVGMLEGGRLTFEGSVAEVLEKSRLNNLVRVAFVDGFEDGMKIIHDSPLVSKISFDNNEIYFEFKGERKEEAELLKRLISAGTTVSFFGREGGSLESLFKSVI